ncbi:MAG: PBP1A family penicillin-binding protein, partial [candidate division Zixibacteria bacterium]|nr:PBP1A family penicillin-binding protein [candidate division Zixibacteria bacterium]
QNDLPSFEQLHNIEPSLITRVYANDSTLIKKFFKEHRILISYNDIPPHLKNALLATEDRNFYSHWGVDLTGILRALYVIAFQPGRIQGGSTITQQLSRLLFLSAERTIPRKIKEALTAIKLERNYSKNEIMAMYLNQSPFGSYTYGIQSASQYYFGKNTDELDINESATLVGMLKAPNRYSPIHHHERATMRRNVVINSMVDYGVLSPISADSLKKDSLNVYEKENIPYVGAYFTEMIRRNLEEHYGEDILYNSGFSVYTTLDYDMQAIGEEIIHKFLDSLQMEIELLHPVDDEKYTIPIGISEEGDTLRVFKKLQGALICIDNKTGAILTMVGGRDFKETKFNCAIQAFRQPGSAFKPFVYTTAIDNGYSPTFQLNDSPIVIPLGDEEWRPHNIDFAFRGLMTIREGLRASRNLIAIKLIMEPRVTPQQVVFYAHQMGIKSPLNPVPSLAIGTSEVNLLEICAAYSVFPNGGIRTEPFYIQQIIDRYESIIEERDRGYQDEVLSSQTTYIMTHMLQTVIDHGSGIGARLRGFRRPAGGKTGTTDDWTDNWFIGFTPQLTTGVWIGFTEDQNTKIEVKENIGETGSSTALPVWTEYMKAVHNSLPVEHFIMPPGLIQVEVCSESGLLPNEKCPKLTEEIFRINQAPTQECTMEHRGEYTPKRQHELKEKEKREATRRIRF